MRIRKIGSIVVATMFLVGLGMFIGFWLYYRTYLVQNQGVKDYLDPPIPKYVSRTGQRRNEELSTSRLNAYSIMGENGVEVAGYEETISVDTDYIILEYDVLRKRKTEIQKELPAMYYGMNQQQFTDAMEAYAMAVPLSEKERGFIGLEVQNFSASRVVVRMDYRYVNPDTCFYLKLINGEVVAFLEDQRTIYMNTGICFEDLPKQIQDQIKYNLCLKGEKELYDFLEAYTS